MKPSKSEFIKLARSILDDFQMASVTGYRISKIQGTDYLIADLDSCNEMAYQVYLRDCDIYKKIKKSFDDFCVIMITCGWGSKIGGETIVESRNNRILAQV